VQLAESVDMPTLHGTKLASLSLVVVLHRWQTVATLAWAITAETFLDTVASVTVTVLEHHHRQLRLLEHRSINTFTNVGYDAGVGLFRLLTVAKAQ
jgi:hypothetical protein